ncbi:hypothetical protein K431DRAFT_234681 [Polychaeton citri CBS 116435]|uniref:Uncharacterized protein n=1 Tax=Polychaeton citri CBS 116435 TaxID=1314669 RepID=A0A9P4Q276_9PEZI|nr:hypothetical protein K431DRAFT_234681 [Polychaeton citri CBS 116435]
MSLARAFTTRRNKQPESAASSFIGRAASHRNGRPVLRSKISLPVELISTTNNLVNYAPDIAGTTPIPRNVSTGSSSSSTSGEDSDASSPEGSIHNESVTDASSIDGMSPIEPAPNHLSCYFKPNVETASPVPSRSPSLSQRSSMEAPDLPQRAPSHSKKAHERLNRKRSIQRMMSPPRSSRDLRSSEEIFSSTSSATVEAPRESPFGMELAQLDEVAEEFGHVVRDAESDADLVSLENRGLARYGASDYMNEISDLLNDLFDDSGSDLAGWI